MDWTKKRSLTGQKPSQKITVKYKGCCIFTTTIEYDSLQQVEDIKFGMALATELLLAKLIQIPVSDEDLESTAVSGVRVS